MGQNRFLKALGLCFSLALFILLEAPAFPADVYLQAKEFTKAMPDGADVTMWGFAKDIDNDLSTDNGEVPAVPGPGIVLPTGDSNLNIHVRNYLGVPISVVIPALKASLNPVRFTDSQGRQRVESFTSEVAPGATGVYSWGNVAPGTYLYQSGTHPSVQVQMGLYGGVKKDASSGRAYSAVNIDSSFKKEVVIFLSEIDPALHRAVADGTYGTPSYPGTIRYNPKYFLINGNPYTSGQLPIPAGYMNENLLIRFLNAGLESHVPNIQSLYFKVIAEDGNLYPYAKEQYSVLLPAGKTVDAILTPSSTGVYPVFDRRLFLMNAASTPGGMVTFLWVSAKAGSPQALYDTYTGNEDAQLNISAPGVLANDVTGGGPLTAVLASATSNGALTLNPDGSFTYMPSLNFNGTDIFTYNASDGGLESNLATVSVRVNPVNDAPVAQPDSSSTFESLSVIVNVLANDTDVDGDALTVYGVTAALNGSAVINPDNTITYTPNAGFTGNDGFKYKALDGHISSNAARVDISVNPLVNSQPVAVDDYATTRMNSSVTVNVLSNDYDTDGTIDPSTVAIVTPPPQGGTAVVNPDGTITFTPGLNFRGTDGFSYRVKDNQGAYSNTAVVRINVIR